MPYIDYKTEWVLFNRHEQQTLPMAKLDHLTQTGFEKTKNGWKNQFLKLKSDGQVMRVVAMKLKAYIHYLKLGGGTIFVGFRANDGYGRPYHYRGCHSTTPQWKEWLRITETIRNPSVRTLLEMP